MPHLTADHDACQGYGNCISSAPDVYDIDDDGKVVLLVDTIPESDRLRVQDAASSCPVSALSIEG